MNRNNKSIKQEYVKKWWLSILRTSPAYLEELRISARKLSLEFELRTSRI
jgi:hypothetical protein